MKKFKKIKLEKFRILKDSELRKIFGGNTNSNPLYEGSK